MSEINTGVTIYEMNKELYKQLDPCDGIFIQLKATEIVHMIRRRDENFMLLNRERNDYTIFTINQFISEKEAIQGVRETLQNRGDVVAIEKLQEEDNYEIWIKDNDEAFMYRLFPCAMFEVDV